MTYRGKRFSTLDQWQRQVGYRDFLIFLTVLLLLRPSVAAINNDPALHEARKLYQGALKLRDAGKYDEAISLFERALEIRERIFGPDHRDVADVLNSMAILYYYKGDYVRAEPLCRRALIIREKALGPWHPDFADSLRDLAFICVDKGDYASAELLCERALTIKERELGPEHPGLASYIHNLALFCQTQRNYVKAEPLYRRALAIREKTPGPEHPAVAQTLNNLANIYRDKGDYANAEPLYERALAIREKALGLEHQDVAQSLNNLAVLHWYEGDYAKAEPLYQRALVIKEKRLGPEHISLATSLNGLAVLYYKKGAYTKAETLHRRALAIREKTLGPKHPEVAISLNNLALVYAKNGDYAMAEPLFQRALGIREKSLGPEHPDAADSLNNLAMLNAAKGDIAQAIAFQSRANNISERDLALNLAIGSERQKLAYLAIFSRQTDFTLSLHSQIAPNDPQALNLAFTTLLRRKGRGLDVMANTVSILRRRATLKDQALLDQLAEARSRYAALTLRESEAAKPETYLTRLKPLEEEIEKLEAELSSHSIEFRVQAQPATLAAVQAALPAGSALVEFTVFTPQELLTGNSKPPRYVAYVLAAQGELRWVDLGDVEIIDRAVNAWRKALRDPSRTNIERLARAVDEKIMRPVRSLLREKRHLLIAPDGLLNLIPFAALVDERKRYLVERYAISYLTSGSDLLRLQTSEPRQSAPLIVANPIFGRVETIFMRGSQGLGISQAGDQVWGQIDPTELFFQPLPGTESEALAIKALLPEASLLLREQATETALKQSRAPHILHIATHGFFLNDEGATTVETLGVPSDDSMRSSLRLSKWAAKIKNPLLRSGLALARVNERHGGDDDGVLTALEVASLDLWGTKLVVLSGCDTGIGEVKNGEGVYGLRRALMLAGSETQILSLWPVLDGETRNLMAGYYRRLLKGGGRGEALRQIQLGMLNDAKLRHPYYWASFIQAGEWANLDGQR